MTPRTLVFVLLASSCTYPLVTSVSPVSAAVTNRTEVTQSSWGPTVKSVMILPPSGSTRGTFEGYLNEFERGFLKRGIRVVSSAVTGRVVQERKNESAAQLSDIERALILARETGADALLQVGSLDEVNEHSRFFCGESANELTECTGPQLAKSTFGRQLSGGQYRFQGRLVDVKTGEVLAALELTAPVVNFLEANLRETDNVQSVLVASCSKCRSEGYWCRRCAAAENQAAEAIIAGVVTAVASQPTAGQPPASPKGQPGTL